MSQTHLAAIFHDCMWPGNRESVGGNLWRTMEQSVVLTLNQQLKLTTQLVYILTYTTRWHPVSCWWWYNVNVQ